MTNGSRSENAAHIVSITSRHRKIRLASSSFPCRGGKGSAARCRPSRVISFRRLKAPMDRSEATAFSAALGWGGVSAFDRNSSMDSSRGWTRRAWKQANARERERERESFVSLFFVFAFFLFPFLSHASTIEKPKPARLPPLPADISHPAPSGSFPAMQTPPATRLAAWSTNARTLQAEFCPRALRAAWQTRR